MEVYDSPINFDNYVIYTDATPVADYIVSYLDQIEISHNKTEEGVVAQVKNNSEDTISNMRAVILYYRGDKIVGYDVDYTSDVKSGRSGNFTSYNPTDKSWKEISFDSYKIYVTDAYTYNHNY